MSYRGQAVYINTCTHPEITFAVNQLTQTTPYEADDSDFKRLMENQYEVRYGNVDFETAEIQGFPDESFADNKGMSSQVDYKILLVDAKQNCSILSWSSSKCKRVKRYVPTAKLCAIAHGYDAGFVMGNTFGKLLNRPMKIRVFTDSRILFDSIVSLSITAEKRLRIDIFCLQEDYCSGESANLGWIRTQHTVADALKKDLKNSALNDVLRSHTRKTPVLQWVEKGHTIRNN